MLISDRIFFRSGASTPWVDFDRPRSALTLLRAGLAPLLGVMLVAGHPASAAPSPAGLWQTFDATGPRSEVRLELSNGVLYGRIEKVLRETDAAHPRCNWCEGERKGAPFIGMVILRDLKPASGSSTRWDGGYVLDPDTGREYRAWVRLDASGNSLELRGFVGFEAFGRSENWRRIESLTGHR